MQPLRLQSSRSFPNICAYARRETGTWDDSGMVFISLYLSSLNKRFGGSGDWGGVTGSPDAARSGCMRLAAIDGRRIGPVKPAEYAPASHRPRALRLVAVNGARLA